MICYLDTSALVKLYVNESDTEKVFNTVNKSRISATSIVAYAEARAAFSRGFHEKILSGKDYYKCISNFRSDWNNYLIINIDNLLILLAGDLAEKYNIRGFDSIHLASAIILKRKLKEEIMFLCRDKILLKAAGKEGFFIT
ncbi:MAG: type II toxin-antitoxin system VapC family toxin [Actinobacteria bacterium]|nr:type II toxin-antitoxin system VapC family toxin [Actinomycetota bacterium]